MAEYKESMTMLERLDACGQAAEQLTKTIGRFDTAGKRLEKSLSELTTFDKMLKGDNGIQTLLTSSMDIRKMLTHFEKNLPAFNEAVTSSRKEMQRYRSDLDSSMKLAAEMMPEIDNLSSLAESIKMIREMLKSVDFTDLRTEIPIFQESLGRLVDDAAKINDDIGNRIVEIKTILPELKELVKSHMDMMEEVHGDLKTFIEERISQESDLIREYIREMAYDLKSEVESIKTQMVEQGAKNAAQQGVLTEQQRALAEHQEALIGQQGALVEQHEALNGLLKTHFSDLHLQLYADIGELIEEQMAQLVKPRQVSDCEEEYGANNAPGKVYSKMADEVGAKPDVSIDDLNEALKNIIFNVDRSKPPRKLNEIYQLNNCELPMIVMKNTWTGEYYFIVSEFDNDVIRDGFYYNNGTFDKGRKMPSGAGRYYPVYITRKD